MGIDGPCTFTARIISDIEGSADVLDHRIMEAIAYRNLDRLTYIDTCQKTKIYLSLTIMVKESDNN